MRWISIETVIGVREEFAGETPEDRDTWFALLLYCGMVENGGRIRECRTWSDRQWLQSARVHSDAVRNESRLWHWDGNDLVVKFYPVEQEAKLKMLRPRSRELASREPASAPHK